MFGPKRKLDPNKYILRTYSVPLPDLSVTYIVLLILTHTQMLSQPKKYCANTLGVFLTVCNTLGIVAPILSTLTDAKASTKKRKIELDLNYTTIRNYTRNTVNRVINSCVM